MQFKGLGAPNKYFATQNKQMYIRLHCLRVLWSLSTCFPNLKIILQSRPSVCKFNLKRAVIFLHKNFRVCNRSKQGEFVPPRNFLNLFFTNPASKRLLGFAQTRCSAKNCADRVSSLMPNEQIFLEKNLFYENRRWFIQYCIKPELSLSVLNVKSGRNAS